MELKMNILIALDEENAKRLNEYFATLSDYKVVAIANDGESAIEKLTQHQPDILIMDLILPKKDGFAILDFINKTMISKKPIVIVTSALSNDAFVTKTLQSGASGFLAKPFSTETIKNQIDTLFYPATPVPKQNQSTKTKIIEEQITAIFLTIGIPAHVIGYQYLKEAIKLTLENTNLVNNMTKELYPLVAKKFDTNAGKIERSIRNAITTAWNRGKMESINQIFGYQVYGKNDKPTNGEFIALVADKIMLDNVR